MPGLRFPSNPGSTSQAPAEGWAQCSPPRGKSWLKHGNRFPAQSWWLWWLLKQRGRWRASGLQRREGVIPTAGMWAFWVLHAGGIMLDPSSDPAIQSVAVFGPDVRLQPSSQLSSGIIRINLGLSVSVFGSVWVPPFRHTNRNTCDSSREAAIILPENCVNRRQPGPPFPQYFHFSRTGGGACPRPGKALGPAPLGCTLSLGSERSKDPQL